MGDRITTLNDCPKCGGKGTFECYEALSSNMKIDECIMCGYTVSYDFIEKKGVTHIIRTTPELNPAPSNLEEDTKLNEILITVYAEAREQLRDYRAGRNVKLKVEIIAEAKSQLKQLILKEKLEGLPKKKSPFAMNDRMGLTEPIIAESVNTPGQVEPWINKGYNQAIDDMEQSARKRYQS